MDIDQGRRWGVVVSWVLLFVCATASADGIEFNDPKAAKTPEIGELCWSDQTGQQGQCLGFVVGATESLRAAIQGFDASRPGDFPCERFLYDQSPRPKLIRSVLGTTYQVTDPSHENARPESLRHMPAVQMIYVALVSLCAEGERAQQDGQPSPLN